MEVNINSNLLQVIIKGSVQGVGFRAFVAEAAQSRGITGWVRNTFEGNVEVFAEGSKSKLDELLNILHSGPNLSEVTKVTFTWSEGKSKYSSFFIAKSS